MGRNPLLILICSVVILGCSSKSYYMKGLDAYNQKDYEKAVSLWKSGAEEEDANCLFRLGWHSAEGDIVPQNYEEARRWYERAAKREILPP